VSNLEAPDDALVPATPAAKQASAALGEFQRIQPYLTSMAQAITRRRDIKVRLSESDQPRSFTDGNTIYISPYKSFSQVKRHTARLCDLRDEHYQQRCEECKRREELIGFLFHEMAHLCWKSFREVDAATNQARPWLRAFWLTDAQRAKIQSRIDMFQYKNYIDLAADTGKYLQFMCNALEDMRIEAAMAKVRANAFDMMTARHMKMLERGKPGKGFYQEFPLNMQITIGLIFLKEGAIPLEDLFTSRVARDLQDPYVVSFVKQIEHWSGMEEVYENAIDLYGYLIGFGYFEQPTPPEQDPQFEKETPEQQSSPEEENDPESQPEPTDATDEESGEGASNDKEPDGDSSDSAGGESDGDSSGEAGSDDSEPEPDLGTGDGEGDPQPEVDPESESSDEAGITGTGDEFDGAPDEGFGSDPSDDDTDQSGDESSGGADTSEMGSPEDIQKAIDEFLGHSSDQDSGAGTVHEEQMDTDLVDDLTREEIRRLAVAPAEFAGGQSNVGKVLRVVYDGIRWVEKSNPANRLSVRKDRKDGYYDTSIVPDESIYARALMQLKLIFEKNARGTKARNLKAGKVNANVLGKRASIGDDRLFYNKALPRKRDYVVLLHLDNSTSTRSGIYSGAGEPVVQTLAFEKKALYAQAELLHRLRIPFIIIAGSAETSPTDGNFHSIVFEVKTAHDPWDDKAKAALEAVPPVGFNLDGHAMLIAIWELMQVKSTDKILMYYTDGEMPYANYEDELIQMKRAFATAKQNKIAIMGVGVRTDSPNAHGLDTVRIDTPHDLGAVVVHLGKRLGLV